MKVPALLYRCLLFPLITFSAAIYAHPVKPAQQSASLSFIENKGQITDQHQGPRNDIDFKLSTSGMNIFIGDGQIHYQWNKNISGTPPAMDETMDRHKAREAFLHYMDAGVKVETYRMDVTLVGANKNTLSIKEDKQSYYENYYLPQYKGSASSFNKIIYKNVYNNIDWVLYTKDNQLKYDFIVHPGGDPKDIKLQYRGATNLNLKDGALIATTPLGSITEQKPYSYDAVTKKEILSSFVLNENTLSFNIPASTTNDIIIDPFLQWATYYGGASADRSFDVATNSLGDAYMCGWTYSTSNIATTGVHLTTIAGNYDGFIVKFNTSGVRQWGTYFGGSNVDWLGSIKCDPSGYIYLGGETTSNGLATPGAHQTVLNGHDALLVKFNSAGNLLWCTYFGGSDLEYSEVATDGSGNVYITGETSSSSGIATMGAYQTSLSGPYDAYLARFNSSGVLQWSTYFGGSESDVGEAIACDPSGNIYMGGHTASDSNIATTGVHQTTHGGAAISWWDGFLSKWNASGSLLWGTYYGGSAHDYVSGIACDLSGNVYASGYTVSTNAIATTGSHQSSLGFGTSYFYDGFLVKFNSIGVRQWGTYYGGPNTDYAGCVEIGSNGNVYISGWTASSSAIATTNGYQTSLAGNEDGFIAEFTTAGVRNWASYYGGSGTEHYWWGVPSWGSNWSSNGMAISPTGKLYFCGTTSSTSGIATTGAHQTVLGNSTNPYDGFLTSWIIDTIVYIDQPYIDTIFCTGDTFRIYYSASYPFDTSNVFTAQISDTSGNFTTPVTIGIITTNIDSFIIAKISDTIPAGSGYRIRLISSNPMRTFTYPHAIRIKPTPKVTATSNSPVCSGDTLRINAQSILTGSINYQWAGPGSFQSSRQNDYRTHADTSMSGSYIVVAEREGCFSYDTLNISVRKQPTTPVAGYNSPVYIHTALTLTANSGTAGVNFAWKGPNGFSSSLQNPTVSNSATLAMAGDYLLTSTLDGCTSDTDTLNIVIELPVSINSSEQLSKLKLYPNPNKGSFTVSGITGTEVSVKIINAVGQVVYRDKVTQGSGELVVKTQLSQGVYLIKLYSNNNFNQILKFTVTE